MKSQMEKDETFCKDKLTEHFRETWVDVVKKQHQAEETDVGSLLNVK